MTYKCQQQNAEWNGTVAVSKDNRVSDTWDKSSMSCSTMGAKADAGFFLPCHVKGSLTNQWRLRRDLNDPISGCGSRHRFKSSPCPLFWTSRHLQMRSDYCGSLDLIPKWSHAVICWNTDMFTYTEAWRESWLWCTCVRNLEKLEGGGGMVKFKLHSKTQIPRLPLDRSNFCF